MDHGTRTTEADDTASAGCFRPRVPKALLYFYSSTSNKAHPTRHMPALHHPQPCCPKLTTFHPSSHPTRPRPTPTLLRPRGRPSLPANTQRQPTANACESDLGQPRCLMHPRIPPHFKAPRCIKYKRLGNRRRGAYAINGLAHRICDRDSHSMRHDVDALARW